MDSICRASRVVIHLPNFSFGTVITPYRLTAHRVFMPSDSSKRNSDGIPRMFEVTGATVIFVRYGPRESRVRMTTGCVLSGNGNAKR